MLSVTAAHKVAGEGDYFSPCDFQSSSRARVKHHDL